MPGPGTTIRPKFSEFATLARYARAAHSAALRTDGQQLTAAVTADDGVELAEAAGRVYATCQELRLVPTSSPTSTTLSTG